MPLFGRFRNNFIAGIAVILPIFVTILVVKWFVVKINALLLEPLSNLLPPFIEETYRIFIIKTLIFILAIAAIVLIGVATRIIFLRRFFGRWEKAIYKLPLVGKIYSTMKEMSGTFLGEKKGLFKKVVLVEYPRKGIYSLGFVTAGAKGELGKKVDPEALYVYIPTTPNPATGMFVVLPKQEVVFLDMGVEEALKIVISGGAVGSPSELPVGKKL